MTTTILSKPYLIPDMPSADDLLPYLRQIDANRWYSNFGPLVQEFEAKFAQTMAKAHGTSEPALCITTSSGHNALSIGMRLLGIQKGWRVLMPAVNFPACPLAVENMGAVAVLADVDPETFTLTPALARTIVAHTKIDAVIPVSLYGIPLPADAWDAFMADTGIPVLIDAAAAVEAQRYPKRGIVAHSLHATKPFGVGEGGLVITYDPLLADKARLISNFGSQGRITQMTGENAKMSEYHAAVGLAQLERWEGIKQRRHAVFSCFKEELKSCEPLATLPACFDQAIVSTFMVRTRGIEAARLANQLLTQGLPVHRTYLPPLYAHPYFSALELANAQGAITSTTDPLAQNNHMTGAALLQSSLIGPPFHSMMQPQDVHDIVKIFGHALMQITGCDNEKRNENDSSACG